MKVVAVHLLGHVKQRVITVQLCQLLKLTTKVQMEQTGGSVVLWKRYSLTRRAQTLPLRIHKAMMLNTRPIKLLYSCAAVLQVFSYFMLFFCCHQFMSFLSNNYHPVFLFPSKFLSIQFFMLFFLVWFSKRFRHTVSGGGLLLWPYSPPSSPCLHCHYDPVPSTTISPPLHCHQDPVPNGKYWNKWPSPSGCALVLFSLGTEPQWQWGKWWWRVGMTVIRDYHIYYMGGCQCDLKKRWVYSS